MYVLIDLERMAFCHCHDEYEVVSCLAHIEFGNTSVHILPGDYAAAYTGLTDLELKLLYKNATGESLTTYSHSVMVDSVLCVAKLLPRADVIKSEVYQQALKIPMGDTGFYKYVKGSYQPAKLLEFFIPNMLSVTPGCFKPAQGAPVVPTVLQLGVTNITPAPLPQTGPKGGIRSLVWSVADSMWGALGNPHELQEILKLRKQIMGELERVHNVKRSTSSTSLGEWQKVRLKE